MNKDIEPRNSKGQEHGYWEIYTFGTLMFKAFYHNGKKVGYEENHFISVILSRKRYHI